MAAAVERCLQVVQVVHQAMGTQGLQALHFWAVVVTTKAEAEVVATSVVAAAVTTVVAAVGRAMSACCLVVRRWRDRVRLPALT
jgi:uncharacterized membrane protein YhaH (DUF805 family)